MSSDTFVSCPYSCVVAALFASHAFLCGEVVIATLSKPSSYMSRHIQPFIVRYTKQQKKIATQTIIESSIHDRLTCTRILTKPTKIRLAIKFASLSAAFVNYTEKLQRKKDRQTDRRKAHQTPRRDSG